MVEMQHLTTKTVLQNDASDTHSHLDKVSYHPLVASWITLMKVDMYFEVKRVYNRKIMSSFRKYNK